MICPATQTDNNCTTYHCTSRPKHPALPCGGCSLAKWPFHLHIFSVFNCSLEGEQGGGGLQRGSRGGYPLLLLWWNTYLTGAHHTSAPVVLSRPHGGIGTDGKTSSLHKAWDVSQGATARCLLGRISRSSYTTRHRPQLGTPLSKAWHCCTNMEMNSALLKIWWMPWIAPFCPCGKRSLLLAPQLCWSVCYWPASWLPCNQPTVIPVNSLSCGEIKGRRRNAVLQVPVEEKRPAAV